MSHVFISYSRKDRETVDKIVARLNSDGVDIWLDREAIRAGDLWRESIVKAVDQAYACVLMLSPNSTASDNVRKEVDLADGANKALIPVLLAPVEVPAKLRYQLAGIQWIEYYRDPEAKYAELLEGLKARDLEEIAREAPPMREVEIVIKGVDISKFGPDERNKLLYAIAEVMNIPPTDLTLTTLRAGSVHAFVQMPADAAYRLKTAALNRDARLINSGIDALRLTGDRHFVLLKTGQIAPLKPGRAGGSWFFGGLALLITLFLSALIITVGLPLAGPFISSLFSPGTPTMINTLPPTPSSVPTVAEIIPATPSRTPTPSDTITSTPTETAMSTPTATPTKSPTDTSVPIGSGGIVAVSRVPNSMEVWWVGADGSVQGAFWYEGSQWNRYELAPAGSASTNGGIAAVSRIQNSMQIWWIGANGSVQEAFWYEGSPWERNEVAPAGSASTNAGIAAVARVPTNMQIWWIGANGSVQNASWYEGDWERNEVAPARSASTNAGIAAVSRIPNSLEVWWVGANGSVQDAFSYDGGNWQQFELAPPDSASRNGGITAVSRVPNSMEVWWVGAEGSVQDAFWYEGGNWQQFEVAPAGSASTNGGITAVSRIPNSMEVWWVGAEGSVQDAFWYESGNWQQFELAPAGSASTNGGVAAVSRIPDSMEIWWLGAKDSVQDAFWYDGGNWQQFSLPP